MSRRSDTRELIRDLRRAGATVVISRSQHWKVFYRGRFIASISHSAGDVNGMRQARRQMRSRGIPIPAP